MYVFVKIESVPPLESDIRVISYNVLVFEKQFTPAQTEEMAENRIIHLGEVTLDRLEVARLPRQWLRRYKRELPSGIFCPVEPSVLAKWRHLLQTKEEK